MTNKPIWEQENRELRERIEELEKRADVTTPGSDNSANEQDEPDYEPVYATLHFYYDDPDSMHRFKMCNEAAEVRSAVWEFDNWLRGKIKYEDREEFQEAQDALYQEFKSRGVEVLDD